MSICLIINIMINIRYIPRCVIQISNSVGFTMHAVSLDFRYSSFSFKRALRSVPQTDARARWHCERLPLNIHVLSWPRQSDTSQSNTQRRTNITIRARNPYIQQMSHIHVVPSPCCPHCDEPESTTHLLLKCNRYAASRSDLFRVIGPTVDKLGIGITNECQINNILLFGHTLLTLNENKHVFQHV